MITNSVRSYLPDANIPPVPAFRILHLEDDPNDRLLVETGIKREGINSEIRTIATREEFCSSVERERFHLIISDSSLPMFDSFEALTIARRHDPEVAFIVFSGGLLNDSSAEKIRKSATAVISKQHIEELIAEVKKVAGHRHIATLPSILRNSQWPSEALTLVEFLEKDTELGILAFDDERKISVWNDELERLFGLPRAEAMKRPVTQVLMELGRNGEDLLMLKIVEGVPMEWTESSHVHRLTRVPCTVSTSFIPLRNAHNVPNGGIVLIRDISTGKRMVKAGMMVENAFRSAVDGAADAILVADGGGRILYGNKKLTRMLGHTSQELVSMGVFDLMDPEGKGGGNP